MGSFFYLEYKCELFLFMIIICIFFFSSKVQATFMLRQLKVNCSLPTEDQSAYIYIYIRPLASLVCALIQCFLYLAF